LFKIDIKPGESISIGDVIVTLEAKSGQIARLAVRADKSVPISRVQDRSKVVQFAAAHGITGKD
jgi:hypothetical protein